MHIVHEGFEAFRKGTMGNAGANLFVDAKGTVRRIADQDLNGNGRFDIVFPNSHGYIERGPTTIYTKKDGVYEGRDLPHDSCWMAHAVDVDGDGCPDLLIANGENGVSSELTSYLYWGGPDGLTGEREEFHTAGAYDACAIDLTGNGLKDLVFTSAWYDHHFPGYDYLQKVFVQEHPRVFREATEEFGFPGNTVMNVRAADLDGNGYDDLIYVGYKAVRSPDANIYIYRNGPDGLAKEPEILPTELITNMLLVDVFGTGLPDIVVTGGSCVHIFRNRNGAFSADDQITVSYTGAMTQFFGGRLGCDIADIDGDGVNEIIVGTHGGLDIRKVTDPDTPWQTIPGFVCSAVKAADLRHTGKMDIVAACYASVKSYDTDSFIFENDHDRYSFDRVIRLPAHGPVNVEAADLDGDGEEEIIFLNTMRGPSQNDPEFPVFCYYADEDYRFPAEKKVDYPTVAGAYCYVTADLDNDGWPELVMTTWDGFRIFKGTPDGPDPKNYYDIHGPYRRCGGALIVADFNHDGWLDILHTDYDARDITKEAAFLYPGGPDGFSEERVIHLHSEIGCAQACVAVDTTGDGYLDFAYADSVGDAWILHGCKDGFDLGRPPQYVPLKNANGGGLIGLTAADVNGDGKVELIGTSAGHYTRRKSYLNILYDPEKGYPVEEQLSFDTGGTTGYVTFADLYHTGNLDLILPFYSTTETRVLPMRIFRSDGKGGYDFDHPTLIPCESAIASLTFDRDRNGYPDLLVCCHRNDIGHTVQSLLFTNGPDGLDLDHPEKLWAYGPHDFTRNCIYNIMDRTESEYYTSPVILLDGVPHTIRWEAEEPNDTKLTMRVRFASSEEELGGAPWSGPVENGGALTVPDGASGGSLFMQYQAEFFAPNACGSPKLRRVEID